MSTPHELGEVARLDLNLLVAFDALAETRSVTRAAARMGVTQSAMSHTLRRLRECFADPLLVRGRGGMVLTPRATGLVVPVRAGLVMLGRALAEPQTFEPATAQRSFRFVSPDLFDVLVLPPLLRTLAAEAPGISLGVVPAPPRLVDALETGELDLAIVPRLLGPETVPLADAPRSDLRQRTLFRDTFRCFVRADHPAINARRRLSMKAYTSLGHVLVSPTGTGPGFVDAELAAAGRERRIAVRVPHFASALAIVEGSDLILTGPASLAKAPGPARVSLAPPLALPEHAITMVWHPRFHDDPAHRWLRARLVEVTAAFPG